MSEIYVKWPKLQHSSSEFDRNATTIRKCAEEVSCVCSRLRLSDDVLCSINSGLSMDVTKLYELSEGMKKYAAALQMVSNLYKFTEETNINR